MPGLTLAQELERLDAISRLRALSDAESLRLERLLELTSRTNAHYTRSRVTYGTRREEARLGVKRDMRQFARCEEKG